MEYSPTLYADHSATILEFMVVWEEEAAELGVG